ncbi:LemA family protein [Lactococcus termiticola]|uniref:LemA family protein n=1 Tax=Lactococcus termiticola TaxID=2169526 RepID=A0A2R5HHK5_9LACT|nr:LemA family protein [Lactococcus termiticola]GBG97336.1 LemA family protein [Lactococcus termiticola]
MIILLVIIAIIVIFVLWLFIGGRNNLVRLSNGVDNAFAQISTQLQRRYDLIPNLVETVKGYAKHEDAVFSKVTEARAAASKAIQTGSAQDVAAAQDTMGQARLAINAVAEQYPDLKANQNFLSLQEELTSTENKVAYARQAYNDSVMSYNNGIEVFPTVLIAGMFGYHKKTMFEVENEAAKEAPKVSF